MAAVKKSVRLIGETQAVLANLSQSGQINWSGSINSLAEQYAMFVEDNTPELTDQEWMVFYVSYNGRVPHRAQEEARILPWQISESYQYDSQVTELLGDVDSAKSFIEKIEKWSASQRLAVIYKAMAFWNKGEVSTCQFDE